MKRETTQYQSIPRAPASQTYPCWRRYRPDASLPNDTRWTHRGELLVPVTFTTGLDYETMSERRKGYENFVMSDGAPQYGEKGELRHQRA